MINLADTRVRQGRHAAQDIGGISLAVTTKGVALLSLPSNISEQTIASMKFVEVALKCPEGIRLRIESIQVSCKGHDALPAELLHRLLTMRRSNDSKNLILVDVNDALKENLTREKYDRLFEVKAVAQDEPIDNDRSNDLVRAVRASSVRLTQDLAAHGLSFPSAPRSTHTQSPLLTRETKDGNTTFSFSTDDLTQPGLLKDLKQQLAEALRQGSVTIDLEDVTRVGVSFVGSLQTTLAQVRKDTGKDPALSFKNVPDQTLPFLYYHKLPGLPARAA